MRQSIVRAIFSAVIMLAVAACSGSSLMADKFPPVTDDGLERIDSKRLDAVYWAEGASLAPYKKIMIADVNVAFRKNWQRDQNSSRSRVNAVDTQEMDRIRATLADSFRDVFTKELQENGDYAIVDLAGPDVLLLQPEIVNLDVSAPDVMAPVSNQVFTMSAGEMTLRMDLVDSSTNALIGRAIDRKRSRQTMPLELTNRVTNRAEAERMMRRWAGTLRNSLDDAQQSAVN